MFWSFASFRARFSQLTASEDLQINGKPKTQKPMGEGEAEEHTEGALAALALKKQDGSHEPECIHVLGLRVKTSAIGKRTFFSCILRAYRLSEGTTTNAQRHAWKTSLEDSTYFPCYESAVWSGKCRVWSVEWKV